jgi:uncharacterized membrane protein (UPF0182 family)
MPQLKKVVVAVGNSLVYADTYQQALELLSRGARAVAQQAVAAVVSPTPTGQPPSAASTDPRLERIRTHLRRYKELTGQGKWAEAGKELEAIEAEARQK